MENLDISKASVSNTTRMLLERGLFEKVRRIGERQIYFKLKEGSLVEFIEKQLQLTLDLESITSHGLELLKEMKDTGPRRLQKANDFHQFMAKQNKNILENIRLRMVFKAVFTGFPLFFHPPLSTLQTACMI
jgi:DNA-binding transcriptional regulator GbsR (MarR family)